MRNFLKYLLAISILQYTLVLHAEQINVAVAANFTAPMREITDLFEDRTGHHVQLSFGSSGRFFAQISNGAPFSMFFSADAAMPAELAAQGLADGATIFTYATGRLVLWSAAEGLIEDGVSVLSAGTYRKLALANPEVAPYGKAAIDFLSQTGLLEASRPHWVQGQNIAQVYQYVFSGNAEFGLVAYSQVIDKETGGFRLGSGWLVPTSMHSPILQNAVILRSGEVNVAAQQLAEFMRSEEVAGIIGSYGYELAAQQ